MRINELILKKIKERLDAGAVKYGEEIQLEDERVFTAESLEEALDMSVYLSAAILRHEYEYSRNLNTDEIKESVASALRLFNKGSMSVLDNKDIQDITELVLKIMKSKIRSKYGIQGLET